jgi:hypothetical protein
VVVRNRAAREIERTTYCTHQGARHVHFYVPYAEANATRLRYADGGGPKNVHVSRLYAIPGGWGWTICRECGVLEKSGT